MSLSKSNGRLTPTQFDALQLLVEHGNGDISTFEPTQLLHNTPMVNLSTARALAKRGYVQIEPMTGWATWGAINLEDDGRMAYAVECGNRASEAAA